MSKNTNRAATPATERPSDPPVVDTPAETHTPDVDAPPVDTPSETTPETPAVDAPAAAEVAAATMIEREEAMRDTIEPTREHLQTVAASATVINVTLTDKNRRNPVFVSIDGPAPFRLAHNGRTYERYETDAVTGDVCYCEI
jgi:hypothetical protein